jgi:hypothetical protein
MRPGQVSSLARSRSRGRQRGATLFIVLLVITLLMGIGTFAARSAAVATSASGSERQSLQARYVAEYGLSFAAAKLSNGGAQSYLQQMRTPPASVLCYGQNVSMPQRSCYRMLYADMQNDVASGGYNACEPAVISSSAPGSLGGLRVVNGTTTWAECDFSVELADLSEGFTMPGFDLGHGHPLKFWYVNVASTGQARIVNTGAGALDPISAESSGTQLIRGRILVGPFPGN